MVCSFPLFGQTKDRDAKITPLIPSKWGGKAVETIYNSFDIIFSGAVRPFQLSDFLVKVTQYEYGEREEERLRLRELMLAEAFTDLRRDERRLLRHASSCATQKIQSGLHTSRSRYSSGA
jgi:hypothetical protein